MLIMLSARYTRQVLMPGKKAWLLRKLKKTSMNYQIQPAKAAVSEASDVRLDKVNDIKARIAAGTYNISSEAVAEKMLGSVSTLTF